VPKTVIVIRHAEKPLGDAPPHGVTADGVADPESLTPQGWQRANASVDFFVGADDGPGSSGLPVPTHLFASQVGPHSSSRRPLETLQPLADRLGLQVDTRFPKQAIGLLAQAILATDGAALVSWEHHLIPSLAALLMGQPSLVPTIWPDDRFDLAWVFEREAGGTGLRFRQVPERLLPGDSSAPIVDAAPASRP
jgi:hypothetical protein